MKIKTHKHTCPCCGKTFWGFTSTADAKYFSKRWKGLVCNDCATWLNYIRSQRPNMEVIAGVCYDFLPPQTNIGAGDMLGGGRMKYILKKDGSTKKSNDIWRIGVVPLHLRHILPDTGWWCSRKMFYRLQRTPFVCMNQGCYDRYHCLRYDIKQEYATGPYNSIPRNYCVGDEKCPSFINILEIQHYDNYETIE